MIGWILLAVMTISDASSDVLLSHGTKQVAQASDLRRWDILGIVARAFQNVEFWWVPPSSQPFISEFLSRCCRSGT